MTRKLLSGLAGLSMVWLLGAGCATTSGSGAQAPAVAADAMPTAPEALMKLSDEQFAKGGAGVAASMVVADRALQKNADWAGGPDAYGAHWRIARAYAELADEGQRDKAGIQAGVAAGRKAVALQPDRVEGLYYLAHMIGYSAQAAGGDKQQVQEMVRVAEKASQVDDKFDHGGPARMLGAVYTRAPDPPVSIGDAEKGVQLLQKAAQLDPAYPGNQVYLAEALLHDEKDRDAEAALQKARALIGQGSWPREREIWSRELTKIEKKLRAKQG